MIQIAPGSVVAHLKGPLLVSKRKQEPPLPQPFDPPVNFSLQLMADLEAENLARTKCHFFDIRAIQQMKNIIMWHSRWLNFWIHAGSGCISHKSVELQ